MINMISTFPSTHFIQIVSQTPLSAECRSHVSTASLPGDLAATPVVALVSRMRRACSICVTCLRRQKRCFLVWMDPGPSGMESFRMSSGYPLTLNQLR